MMNDLDAFMGLIKESHLKLPKLKKIILENYFRKFMFNLSHKELKKRKEYLSREVLSSLSEDFMSIPFDLDL